ncbi:hypothetical protein NL676_003447 [Syzygium grande]|nr:hypothetical protein NL676_003447 [Syzygium grande]
MRTASLSVAQSFGPFNLALLLSADRSEKGAFPHLSTLIPSRPSTWAPRRRFASAPPAHVQRSPRMSPKTTPIDPAQSVPPAWRPRMAPHQRVHEKWQRDRIASYGKHHPPSRSHAPPSPANRRLPPLLTWRSCLPTRLPLPPIASFPLAHVAFVHGPLSPPPPTHKAANAQRTASIAAAITRASLSRRSLPSPARHPPFLFPEISVSN